MILLHPFCFTVPLRSLCFTVPLRSLCSLHDFLGTKKVRSKTPTSNRRELHVRPVEPGVVDSMLPGELAKSADPFGVHTASETDARHCLFSLAPPKKPLKKPLQNRSKNILVDIGFALSGTCPRIIFNVAATCWRPLSQKRIFLEKTTK